MTAGKSQPLLKVVDWPFILIDEDINLTAGRLQILLKAANWSLAMLYHCGRLHKPNTCRSSSSEQLLSFLLDKDITAIIRDRSSKPKSCASRTNYGLQHTSQADVIKANHPPQTGDIHSILASRTLLLLPPRPNAQSMGSSSADSNHAHQDTVLLITLDRSILPLQASYLRGLTPWINMHQCNVSHAALSYEWMYATYQYLWVVYGAFLEFVLDDESDQ